MTNLEQMRSLLNLHQRQADLDPLAEAHIEMDVMHFTRHDLKWGFVTFSNLHMWNADQVIESTLRYYRERGYNLEWKYYSYDSPPDLPERLLAAGLVAEELEAVMMLDIEHAPDILLRPPQADIRQLQTLEEVADADAVHLAVWGDEGAVSQRVGDAWSVNRDSVSVYVAYVDGVPASYGRIEFSPPGNPFVSIWGGATLPQHRQRGLYTGLVAARIQEAQRRGYRYVVIDADPQTSMPILQKLGFVTIANTRGYVWEPQDAENPD